MSLIGNHYPELLDQYPEEPLYRSPARRNPAAEARLTALVAHQLRCSVWPSGRNPACLDEDDECHGGEPVSFAG